MTEDQVRALHNRIHVMAKEDLLALDPICEALKDCWARERPGVMGHAK